MANNAFPANIPYVLPGSPVTAGNTNAAARSLEARTNYLREVMDAVETGQVIVAHGVTVSASVLVGQPVFWNAVTLQFEQAFATVNADPGSGTLTAAPSANVLGVCWNKTNATLADVVLYGLVEFPSLANSVTGPAVPGPYYLSAAAPGMLVLQKPSVGVDVLTVMGPLTACDQAVAVFVRPSMRDFIQDHIHFSFKLAAAPAGTAYEPAVGAPHTIVDPDPFQRGWLPATHPTFGGKAPAEAAFGYNLSMDAELYSQWPPIPVNAVLLEIFRPHEMVAAGRVPPEQCRFDENGIWWMTDCYGQVPWPTSWNTDKMPASLSSSGGLACPFPEVMSLILSFIKMTFMTDKTVVTSLRPGAGQPLAFVNCNGQPAVVGDLYAQLNLALTVQPNPTYGSTVLKGIQNNQFQQGQVLEGIVPGSSNILISSTQTRNETPGNTATPVVYQGIVTLDVNLTPTGSEIFPQIIRLADALERLTQNVPYIGFPVGRTSAIRLTMNIPPVGLPANAQLELRLVLFGLAVGTLSGLTASYYTVPRPNTAPSALVDVDVPITLNTAVAVNALSAVEIVATPFPVNPGDTVMISITRAVTATPTYAGEIGLLRIGGVLV